MYDKVVACLGITGMQNLTYDRQYPFAWLWILAKAAPIQDELVYANHANGFALYSMRSPEVTCLYLQVPSDTDASTWSEAQIWDELRLRLGTEINEDPLIEKSVTGMRSFVTEPMGHGKLFLAGDAAHIVPPTGAKGMNLAVADVRILAEALGSYLRRGDETGIDEAAANATDPLLSSLPPERAATLVAVPTGEGELTFDIRLQGGNETVFLAV